MLSSDRRLWKLVALFLLCGALLHPTCPPDTRATVGAPLDPPELPHWSRFRERPASNPTIEQVSAAGVEIIVEQANGWPMRCMVGAVYVNMSMRGARVVERDSAIILDNSRTGFVGRVLPCRPIVIGFTVNTAMYACVLGVLVLATRRTRGALRLRRGRCARCGYPIGRSAVCSECGSAAESRQR